MFAKIEEICYGERGSKRQDNLLSNDRSLFSDSDDVNWGEMARLHRRIVRQGQETNSYFTRTRGKSCYRCYGA